VLTGIGVPAEAVASLAALCAELRRDGTAGVTAVILTEEALADSAEALMACLAGQPPWSDLPIVALTASGRRRGSGR
ncbi:hypothetical protein, partial [Providencia rettgeri]|uniref:hypothetical protein n=1 Tax=Providencia rettgeri TaxID=587 RepID=UPI0023615613